MLAAVTTTTGDSLSPMLMVQAFNAFPVLDPHPSKLRMTPTLYCDMSTMIDKGGGNVQMLRERDVLTRRVSDVVRFCRHSHFYDRDSFRTR